MEISKGVDCIKIKDIIPKVRKKVIDILLMANSSTTRLLEIMTGQDIQINVVNQKIIEKSQIDDQYKKKLECSDMYLKRIVSLKSGERIFSDNIVIGLFDNISDDIKNGLFKGEIPLGKLITDKESKRELLWTGYVDKSILEENFDQREFLFESYLAKKYLIHIEGRCWFYLLEIFHIDEIMEFYLK